MSRFNIPKIFNIFGSKKHEPVEKLLNEVIRSMVTVEDKYNELHEKYNSKVVKENILKILIKASQLIASDEIDFNIVNTVFQTVCEDLSIDEIFIAECINNVIKVRTYTLDSEKTPSLNTEIMVNDVPSISQVFSTKQGYIVNDNQFQEEHKEYFNAKGIKAVCVLPIIVQNKIWGVFGFNSYVERSWTEDNISVCKILTSMICTYVKKKMLYSNLKEHSNYLNAVITSLPTALVIVDAETHTIIGANPSAEKITGYMREELVGQKCYHRLCAHKKGECPVTDLGRTINNIQCALFTKFSEKVIIMKSVTSVLLNGKKHLLESFIDVTEQEKSKQLLKESEHKFRTLFENIPTAICGCTCDGTIAYWNKASEELFGYSVSEIIDSNISNLINEEAIKNTMLKLIEISCIDLTDVPYTYIELKNKNGKAISMYCTATAVKPRGKVPITYFLCLDVTDLKNTEKALKEQFHVLNTTVDLIDGYMWNKDAEGRYLYCTPKWKSLFFRLSDDTNIVGRTDIDLLNEFRAKTGLEHTYGNVCSGTDQHCIAQKQTCYYIEAGYIAGDLFLLEVTKTPLFDSEGNIKGVVGIARDRSSDASLIKIMLHEYIKKGMAINLNPDKMHDDRVVAYWIKSKDEYNSLVSQSGIIPR